MIQKIYIIINTTNNDIIYATNDKKAVSSLFKTLTSYTVLFKYEIRTIKNSYISQYIE